MAYTATYTSDDLDDIVIDFVGTGGVAYVGFATLVALLLLGGWFMAKTKRFKM